MNIQEILLRLDAIAQQFIVTASDQQFVAKSTQEDVFARFFFPRAKGKCWLNQALTEIEEGNTSDEGKWLRLLYFLRIISDTPDAFVNGLRRVRKRLTGRMLFDVIRALLQQPSAIAWTLRPFVSDYIHQTSHVIATDLGAYLLHVAKDSSTDIHELAEMVASIVEFLPDPKQEEKKTASDQDLMGWEKLLEPRPRFDAWEYQQILEKAVRPLAQIHPLAISQVLLSAVLKYLHLKTRQTESENGVRLDMSVIWCPRVDVSERGHINSGEALVHTLSFSCQIVYGLVLEDPAGATTLDRELRFERWTLVDRIRFHCYSTAVAGCVLWIVNEVEQHATYSEESYGFEFATMIRKAAETFGEQFLSRVSRQRIFEEIIRGPSDEQIRRFASADATEEQVFEQRRHIMAKRLWPFEPVLFDKYLEIFKESSKTEGITATEFQPFRMSPVRHGESRSPATGEMLAAMSDTELISFLNGWTKTERDSDWWIETNFDGLATNFRQLVRAQIQRFAAFQERWKELKRPIYIRYAIDGVTEALKANELPDLGPWLWLCLWVAEHENPRVPDAMERSEASDVAPNWEPARRAAVDLAAVCVDPAGRVGLERRDQLGKLLGKFSTGFDTWLDSGKSTVTPSDPLTDAINTTRGRALEALVQYALWIRKQSGDSKFCDPLKEVRAVMDERFESHPALVPAEYAQLGRLFPFLQHLDRDWSSRVKDQVFKNPGSAGWQSAFGTFIVFTEPNIGSLELLRTHYEYAVANITIWLREGARSQHDFLLRLGHHLFVNYLWGHDSLAGPGSLLKQFYDGVSVEVCGALMQYVGQSLQNSPDLDSIRIGKCTAFFERRLNNANPTELASFASWLDANCLNVSWRLKNFIATLRMIDSRDRISTLVIASLRKLLEKDPDLVVEAFAELVRPGFSGSDFYFDKDEVMPILKAGYMSHNQSTQRLAQRAQESLLNAGLFDYLAITDQ